MSPIEAHEEVTKIVEVGEQEFIVTQEVVTQVIEVGIEGPQAGTVSGMLVSETPIGTVNGTNTVFRLTDPATTGSLSVYLNGILLSPGDDYDEITSDEISMYEAPWVGDKMRVTYVRGM